MILIAHRGNTQGPNEDKENSLEYIDEAIRSGFNVEIDIWGDPYGGVFLGHDSPTQAVSIDWLRDRRENLWLHAKDLNALTWFSQDFLKWKIFWHQKDDFTLTSNNYIWTYPGKKCDMRSIIVALDLETTIKLNDLEKAGICSDYVGLLKEGK